MALVAAAVGSFAQSAVSSAGYEATGDGTVSATIGQVAYLTATGDGGSIAQGVQQTFEITTETGIEITEINAGCICCTLKGDFEAALRKLNEQYEPDHIIILFVIIRFKPFGQCPFWTAKLLIKFQITVPYNKFHIQPY